METDILVRQNQWWKKTDTIEEDYHLGLYKESKIKWQPKLQYEFVLDKDLIYVLRGPRQVGKTTLLKLIIKDLLLKDKVDPRTVFYFACDQGGIQNDRSLKDLLETYIDWTRETVKKQRLYIFLDEVTYTKKWSTGVKVVADTGRLKNAVVIATGSHAIDLKHGAERMPGRRGVGIGLDKIMLPMNFREFLFTVLSDLSKKIPFVDCLEPQKVYKQCRELTLHQEEINNMFMKYLVSGGFPKPVSKLFSENRISKDIYELYRHAIVGDLVRMGKREDYFRQISSAILNKMTNPFDWRDIVNETEVGSHNTVSDYIFDIEQLFIWNVFYHIKSIGGKKIAFKKRKKIYFKDPFIFHNIRAWCERMPDEWSASKEYVENKEKLGHLVESIVATHLKSHFEDVFYWRKDSEDEIDFAVLGPENRWTYIEAKYQTNIVASEAKRLRKVGGGIILSKNTLDISPDKKIVIVPVHLFRDCSKLVG